MTTPKVRAAAKAFHEKLAARHEPRHMQAVGTVSSVSRNAAGQIVRATVTLPGGVSVQNLDASGRHGLGAGAKVMLDSVGSKAAPQYRIVEVIEQAPGTPGTGTGEIVSTPVHAFIETAAAVALAGTVLINAEFGFYLIAEQWRYDQSIAYEVEVRNATTLVQAFRARVDAARAVAGLLRTAVDDNDTTIEVQSDAQHPYTEFDHSNGIASIEDELVRYESTDEEAGYLELLNATRGALGTTKVAHGVNVAVVWRGMSVPVPNLVQDTAYEAHVRAINANGTASNWSNWESFSTAGGVETAEDRTADLITNGTFDSNVTGWSLGGLHSATLAHAPSVGLRAAGSAYIEENGAGAPTQVEFTQGSIAVTPGNTYRARLYATVDGDILASDSFTLRLIFDSFNAESASPAVAGDQMGTLGNRKWIAFDVESVAPKDATAATLRFDMILTRGVGDQSRVYVDDVRMWEAEQSADALAVAGVDTDELTIGGAGLTGILSNTATLNFGSINAGSTSNLTITVTGAASGDTAIATPAAAIEFGLTWCAFVSAADTVTVRITNVDGGVTVDPASLSWRATVFKF